MIRTIAPRRRIKLDATESTALCVNYYLGIVTKDIAQFRLYDYFKNSTTPAFQQLPTLKQS